MNDGIESLYEDKLTGKIPEDIALNLMREFTDGKMIWKRNCRF